MFVLLEDVPEIITAGWQHQFVSCYLVIFISDNCDVMEVILIPQETEGVGHIGLEIIPFEAELLRHNVNFQCPFLLPISKKKHGYLFKETKMKLLKPLSLWARWTFCENLYCLYCLWIFDLWPANTFLDLKWEIRFYGTYVYALLKSVLTWKFSHTLDSHRTLLQDVSQYAA